jgi:hypothetical protein
MKFMSIWTLSPGTIRETVDRFLAGEGAPAEGVTLLGRWHNVDCSGGFALFETNNAVALHQGAAKWSDVLEISITPVIEDAEAGPSLAAVFKK